MHTAILIGAAFVGGLAVLHLVKGHRAGGLPGLHTRANIRAASEYVREQRRAAAMCRRPL